MKPKQHRNRIILLIPYWSFWEKSVDLVNLREDRLKFGRRVSKMLSDDGFDVVALSLVDSEETGAKVAQEIKSKDLDAILIIQLMGVPPTFVMATVEKFTRVPIVVWAVQQKGSFDSNYDEGEITFSGATVGTPMLTSVLVRRKIAYKLIVGAMDDEENYRNLAAVLRAASIAGHVKHANVGKIGAPIPGYECVSADEKALQDTLGITITPVDADELINRYQKVSKEDIKQVVAQTKDTFQYESDLKEVDEDSVRLVVALRNLDTELALNGGTINCHVDKIRFCESPGITPCFALGCETTRGIPWTCTGDILTLIVMLIVKRISGAALYHEIQAFDEESNEVILANSGEHDLGWCKDTDRPILHKNPWYISDPKTGVCAKFAMRPGPATLVGFAQTNDEPFKFRFVTAEGFITDRTFPNSPTVSGAFTFQDELPVTKNCKQWIEAGVNHHSAAGPGHFADVVSTVAYFLGAEHIHITQ